MSRLLPWIGPVIGIALGVSMAGTAAARDASHDHAGHQQQGKRGHVAHQQHQQHQQHEQHEQHQQHEGHEGHAAHPADLPDGKAAVATSPLLPPPTEADRAAAFPALTRPMDHAPRRTGALQVERLEAVDSDNGTGLAWEAAGWYGTDLDRLWLRAEGERSDDALEAASIELLYGGSVSAWWDVLAGVHHDFAPGDARTWAAIGVQGTAPGLLELRLTGRVSGSGRTALVAEAEYDLPLAPRLVLQPVVEVTAFGQTDTARGTGAGLSTLEAGLRLRYDVTPGFAPYVGVEHIRSFGRTADLLQASGGQRDATHAVAGVRFLF